MLAILAHHTVQTSVVKLFPLIIHTNNSRQITTAYSRLKLSYTSFMLSSDVLETKVKAKASTLKAKAWTFKAKAIAPKAKDKAIAPKAKDKAFNHTARTEMIIRSTSDSLTG